MTDNDESTMNNEEEYIYDNSIKDDLDLSLSESDESMELTSEKEPKDFDVKIRQSMINMRSIINNIKVNVKNKYEKLQKFKSELKLCDNHISELKKENQTTLEEIETSRNNGNIAALFRLQSQLKRIQIESEGEKDLRILILEKINRAEQDYINSQLEEGKFVFEEEKLKADEQIYEKKEKEKQDKRLQKEKKLTKNALQSLEFDQKNTAKIMVENQQNSELTNKANKKAHKKHSEFLQKTVEKERIVKNQIAKETAEKEKKKYISMQKLNSEIVQIKENLTAINSKRKSDKVLEHEKELELRKSVIEKGGNPNLEVKLQRKQLEISKEKEQLMNAIKEKKLKIADKIVAEEDNFKRKIKMMPQLFQERMKPSKVSSMHGITEQSLSRLNDKEQLKTIEKAEIWSTWDKRPDTGKSSLDEDFENDFDSTNNFGNPIETKIKSQTNSNQTEETNVITPEFQGLWDTIIDYKVSKTSNNFPIKVNSASKMDQEIMSRVLHQLKENIIQPQIVNRKVFKGHSFQSKPNIITFENLDVNEKYQQKVVLTNTSYSTNQCRFESVSENLLDFVTIKFAPAGPLSPGMTCEFVISFEAKLNEDLFGEIRFTSQSEKFAIPVKCLTKKCRMSIDRQVIKFDTSVIGENLVQTVKLQNSGAKGTFCSIRNMSEMDNETHQSEGQEQNPVVNIDVQADLLDTKQITTTLDNLKLWIEPYGEQEILIRWLPIFAGDCVENFRIQFEDEDNKDFDLRVSGRAIDVPVYIEDQTVSMDICMLDRLYQDTIVFNSRAATALKLHFHVPSEIKDYLEILPSTGFIQAGQAFKAQIKLLARKSILTEKCPYFDTDTGILDVLIKTSIANQVKTVDFNLQAILTTTDIEIFVPDSTENLLDFGPCTIKETKIQTIKLVNKCILPQEFGFTGCPEYIEIQPNYGYGIILPHETLELKVLFSPTKVRKYNFQLKCQSLIDRSFVISCTGIGVHPALDLSTCILGFPHTAIDDQSKLDVYIQNNHLSTNIYTHEPPQIGGGAVVPIGPQTFQFIIPDNSPIFIHPKLGSLNPNEKQKVSVFFEPTLSTHSIKTEAAILLNRKLELSANEKWESEIAILKDQTKNEREEPEKVDTKSKKSDKKSNRSATDKNKSGKSLEELIATGPDSFEIVKPENIEVDSNDYLKGKLSLLEKFDFNFEIFNVKCVIAAGHISDRSSKIAYNMYNSLYLELHCPSIKPDLIILSNSGKPIIEFAETVCNKKLKKTISIQNISKECFQVRSTMLNPNGVFHICNAVRKLEPNAVANIIVSFISKDPGVFQSNWSLFGENRNKILKITLKAQAITPVFEFKELQNGEFNCGAVLINEYNERPLTITNNSTLNVDYRIELSSHFYGQSNLTTKNKNSLCIYNVMPERGVIAAGKSQTVTVSFSPDHVSDKFREILKFFIFDQVEYSSFVIRGEGKNSTMYLKIDSPEEKLSMDYFGQAWTFETVKTEDNTEDEKPSINTPIILKSAYSDDGLIQEAKFCFTVGCVRTLAVSQKKNGEYSIDNLNVLTPLGFTIDPAKGQIEADTEKSINISWIPPSNYEVNFSGNYYLNEIKIELDRIDPIDFYACYVEGGDLRYAIRRN